MEQKKPNSNTRLINLRDAASRLGISYWGVIDMVTRQKKVASYKIGRRRLMSTDDLDAIIAAARQEPQAEGDSIHVKSE